MKKILLSFLLCGVIIVGLTGCNNSTDSNKTNDNSINDSNNNDKIDSNKSEFEIAINNLINAKSIEMEFKSTSDDLDKFQYESRGNIYIDYKSQKIDVLTNYVKISTLGNDPSYDEHVYYDMNLEKEYNYDKECKTWWWYKYSYDTYKKDTPYIKYLDKIKYLDEKTAKKVSNNYHFATDEGTIDVGIENNNIIYIMVGTGSKTGKISLGYEYYIKNLNNTEVTFPSDVKKAVPENNLCS